MIGILEKDIYKSFFYGDFKYELNKLYSTIVSEATTMRGVKTFDSEVRQAYSMYFHYVNQLKRDLVEGRLFAYGQGFHSIVGRENTKRKAKKWSSRRIVKCIVPKGSEVYYDETGLCVSNQIIVKELLKKGRYK